MDRVDPGRAGIGDHDAGGAEDRQAADDAEPRVQRLRRHLLAAGNGNLDLDIAARARARGDLGDRRAHHLARHGVDRRLARRNRQARPRHRADACAGLEADAAPGAPGRTVARTSAPCVTSGSSPASLTTPAVARAVALAIDGKREGDALAAGQRDLDGIGKLAGQQRGKGRLGRGRGAGAGGPAAPQRACLVQFVHGKGNKALPPACHREGYPA